MTLSRSKTQRRRAGSNRHLWGPPSHRRCVRCAHGETAIEPGPMICVSRCSPDNRTCLGAQPKRCCLRMRRAPMGACGELAKAVRSLRRRASGAWAVGTTGRCSAKQSAGHSDAGSRGPPNKSTGNHEDERRRPSSARLASHAAAAGARVADVAAGKSGVGFLRRPGAAMQRLQFAPLLEAGRKLGMPWLAWHALRRTHAAYYHRATTGSGARFPRRWRGWATCRRARSSLRSPLSTAFSLAPGFSKAPTFGALRPGKALRCHA